MKTRARAVIALLTGIVIFISLFPFSGDDSDPPKYYSVFGYGVPTGSIWLPLAAAIVVGTFIWIGLGRIRHRGISAAPTPRR